MSNPSYLPDDSSIDAETDNSHVFDADVTTHTATDVRGSTLRLTVESPAQFGQKPTPRREWDMPSFFDVFGQCVARSEAGSLARQEVILMDNFHDSDVENYGQWFGTTKVFDKKVPGRSESLSESLDRATDRVYDVVWSHFVRFCELAGFEPPITYEDGKQTDLYDLADYVVEYKCVWEPFYGGKVEETVGEELIRRIDGVDEWVAHTDDVSAHTGIDNPESAGIDLYLPGVDKTVQVKYKEGGDLADDVQADWVARYVAPDNDEPYVKLSEN